MAEYDSKLHISFNSKSIFYCLIYEWKQQVYNVSNFKHLLVPPLVNYNNVFKMHDYALKLDWAKNKYDIITLNLYENSKLLQKHMFDRAKLRMLATVMTNAVQS